MHVYAPPFAQLVESPTTLAGSPMQIDTVRASASVGATHTHSLSLCAVAAAAELFLSCCLHGWLQWNRDKMSINGTDPFVPGPYPKNALAPRSGPGAIYSGLLECPLTSRIKKSLDNGTADAPFGKASGNITYL